MLLTVVARGFVLLVAVIVALVAVAIIQSIVEDKKRKLRNENSKNIAQYKSPSDDEFFTKVQECRNDFV